MAGGDAIWNSIPIDHSSGESSPCNALLDFVTEGTLTELCKTISLFIDDLDVETNASRTLRYILIILTILEKNLHFVFISVFYLLIMNAVLICANKMEYCNRL